MSAISSEQVKQWVRDEVKRILEAGLMYTEGCNGTGTTPTIKPTLNPALIWEPQPATEKGTWEKCSQTLNPALQEIIKQLTDHNNFYSDAQYKYWLLTEKDNKTAIKGVGRRQLSNA